MRLPAAKRRKLAAICIGSELFFGKNCMMHTQILLNYSQKTEPSDYYYYWLFTLHNEYHTRINSYFEDWLPKYLDQDFYLLFRMRRNTFYRLRDTIETYIVAKEYHGEHFPVPLEKCLLITICYLARSEVMLSIGDRFNVATSTVYNCITKIFNVSRNLIHLFIKWPTINQARSIASEFKKIAGFPDVIGVIDGCHIRSKVPKAQHDSYQDRKFQHSITIQAICTTSKLFTNIASGYPGSLHDARVLRESTLQKNISVYGEDKYFYGRYHLLGDSAYPCTTWLICPYRDTGNLTREEKYFNTSLSKTRVTIENSFSLLKCRWIILKCIGTYCVKRAVAIINTCCMLHNFCILEGDALEEEPSEEENSLRYGCVGEDEVLGASKRSQIMRLLWENRQNL